MALLKEKKQVEGEIAFITINEKTPNERKVEFKPFSKFDNGYNAQLYAIIDEQEYILASYPYESRICKVEKDDTGECHTFADNLLPYSISYQGYTTSVVKNK